MVTAINLLVRPSPKVSEKEGLLDYLDYAAHTDSLEKWREMRKNLQISVNKLVNTKDLKHFIEEWTRHQVFVNSEQFLERCIAVLYHNNIEVVNHSPQFTFITIPEMTEENKTYIDVYNMAHGSSCCICNKKGELLFCMLCGDKLCRSKCAEEMPDRQTLKDGGLKIHGNGAKHAYQHHAGRCVFFDVYTARYFAYDTQKVAMFSLGYKDLLGREVNVKDMEYDSLKKYRLNRPLLMRLRDEFRSGKLRRQRCVDPRRSEHFL